jgi:hypothetical protein
MEQAEADTAQAKILKGMKDIAKDKDNKNFNDVKQAEPLKPKRLFQRTFCQSCD